MVATTLTRDERLAQRAEAHALMFRAAPVGVTLEARDAQRAAYLEDVQVDRKAREEPAATLEAKFFGEAPELFLGNEERLAEKREVARREKADYDERRRLLAKTRRDSTVDPTRRDSTVDSSRRESSRGEDEAAAAWSPPRDQSPHVAERDERSLFLPGGAAARRDEEKRGFFDSGATETAARRSEWTTPQTEWTTPQKKDTETKGSKQRAYAAELDAQMVRAKRDDEADQRTSDNEARLSSPPRDPRETAARMTKSAYAAALRAQIVGKKKQESYDAPPSSSSPLRRHERSDDERHARHQSDAYAEERQFSEERRGKGFVSSGILEVGHDEDQLRLQKRLDYAAALRKQVEERQQQSHQNARETKHQHASPNRQHRQQPPPDYPRHNDDDRDEDDATAIARKKKCDYAAALRAQMAEKSQTHHPRRDDEVHAFYPRGDPVPEDRRRRLPRSNNNNKTSSDDLPSHSNYDDRHSGADDDDFGRHRQQQSARRRPPQSRQRDRYDSDDDGDGERTPPRRRRRSSESRTTTETRRPSYQQRLHQQEEDEDQEDESAHYYDDKRRPEALYDESPPKRAYGDQRRYDAQPSMLSGLLGKDQDVRKEQHRQAEARIAAELREQIQQKQLRPGQRSASSPPDSGRGGPPPGYRVGPTGQLVRIDAREEAGKRLALAPAPPVRPKEELTTPDQEKDGAPAIAEKICEADSREEADRKAKASAYAEQLERDLAARASARQRALDDEKRRSEEEERRLAKERAELEEVYERDARNKAMIKSDDQAAVEEALEARRRQKEQEEETRRKRDLEDDARVDRERRELAAKFEEERSPLRRPSARKDEDSPSSRHKDVDEPSSSSDRRGKKTRRATAAHDIAAYPPSSARSTRSSRTSLLTSEEDTSVFPNRKHHVPVTASTSSWRQPSPPPPSSVPALKLAECLRPNTANINDDDDLGDEDFYEDSASSFAASHRPPPSIISVLEEATFEEPLPTPPPPRAPTPRERPRPATLTMTTQTDEPPALELLPRAVAALKAALETSSRADLRSSRSAKASSLFSDDPGDDGRSPARRAWQPSILARAGADALTPLTSRPDTASSSGGYADDRCLVHPATRLFIPEAPAPAIEESFDLAAHLDRNAQRLTRLRKLELAADSAIAAADKGKDADDALINLAAANKNNNDDEDDCVSLAFSGFGGSNTPQGNHNRPPTGSSVSSVSSSSIRRNSSRWATTSSRDYRRTMYRRPFAEVQPSVAPHHEQQREDFY